MKRAYLVVVCVLVAAMVEWVGAVEPNYVRTITRSVGYDESDNLKDVVTTEYSNGHGKSVQTKLKLDDDKDRVSCIYYNEAGRPSVTTKSFVDEINEGLYLPGEITDTDIKDQLEGSNGGDTRAFSETEYREDPLGRVKVATGPGQDYENYGSRAWDFGTSVESTSRDIDLDGFGSVTFEDGMITAIDPDNDVSVPSLLDGLYEHMLSNDCFGEDPAYTLSVAYSIDGEDEDNIEIRISEKLMDIFGRTLRTLNAPDVDGITGSKISAAYDYNILGNTIEEIPPKNAATISLGHTTYRYNTRGQPIRKETPDGNTIDYEYYSNGQLHRMILWNDDMTQHFKGVRYFYDDLGRQTEVVHEMYGVWERRVLKKFYDNLDAVKNESVFSPILEEELNLLANLKGRLAGTVTSNYISSNKKIDIGELYSYNNDGLVDWKYLTISGSPLVQKTVYFYDLQGKVTHEAFYYQLDHMVKRYSYDELGRLKKVEQGMPNSSGTDYTYTPFAEYIYDDLGKMNEKLFTGITTADYGTSFDYDILDRLTAITSTGGDGEIQGFTETMSYTLGGNINNADFTYDFGAADPETFACLYRYDDVNRLYEGEMEDRESNSTSFAYTYDAAGRFKSKEEGTSIISDYSYYGDDILEGRSNRLKTRTKDGQESHEYIYDKKGNMVVDYTKNMVIEYDWRNLPVAFRFYDDLRTLGIPKAVDGTYNGTSDLFFFMKTKVDNNEAELVSSVMMAYDAGGNRVCKMDVEE